jgi:hypothetical protein
MSVISLLLTGHWCWILLLSCSLYRFNAIEYQFGLCLALLWLGIVVIFQQDADYLLYCRTTCSITHIQWHTYNIPLINAPVQVRRFEPYTVYQIKGPILLKRRHHLLPIVKFILPYQNMIKLRKISPSKGRLEFLWSSSKQYVKSFYNCFILGIYPKDYPWYETIKAMGLMHVVCFSGWHSTKIFTLMGRNYFLFIPVGCYLSWLLDYSFPFVRAFIMQALAPVVTDRFLRLHVSLICALLCNPFSYLSWSFWLTLYYAILIEYKTIDHLDLKFFGLGWAIIFNQGISPVLILIGVFMEPFLIFILYPISWGSVVFEYLFPGCMDNFFIGCMHLFDYIQRSQDGVLFFLEDMGVILLSIPFYLFPSSKKKSV